MLRTSWTHKDHTQKKICPRTKKGTVKFKLPQISIGTQKHKREQIKSIGYTLEEMLRTSWTHKDHTQKKICPRTKKGTVKFKLPQISIGTQKTQQGANQKHWTHSGGDVQNILGP